MVGFSKNIYDGLCDLRQFDDDHTEHMLRGGGGRGAPNPDDTVHHTGTLGPIFSTRGVGYLYNATRTRELVFPLRLHAAVIAALPEGAAVEFDVNSRGMVTRIAPLVQ